MARLTHSLDQVKSGANAEFELWVGSYSSHWNNPLVSHHQPSLLEPTFSSARGEAGVKMSGETFETNHSPRCQVALYRDPGIGRAALK